MELFSYVFFLGIVYISFSLIWGFFWLIFKLLTLPSVGNRLEGYILKAINFYFLASLTAMKALDYMNNRELDNTGKKAYLITGAIVLYLYLYGKMQRNKFRLQVSGNFSNIKISNKLKGEEWLIPLALLLYSFSMLYPQILDNSVNTWFYNSINDLYNAPVIGWIIGLVGIFFLIGMIFNGLAATGRLFQRIGDIFGGKPPKNNDGNKDHFSDFEIIEEDEEDETKELK
ncbi:MAG: hypothetical protein ACK4K0_01235 [Flavobacteriales bacterium]